MLITEEVFAAFLKCETKSFLKASDTGVANEFGDWQRRRAEDYKQKCFAQLCSKLREDECLFAASLPQALESPKHRLVLNCLVQAEGLQSCIHALERLPSPGKTKHSPCIPIRLVPHEKITTDDRLLLAFDALVLATATGKMPPFGKIIHGREQKTLKIQLAGLMKTTRSIVAKITAQASGQTPPLILNKHCPECEFQSRCRPLAVEKDDLSLLASMTEKERKKQHDKGIFSVTQLSYTFRPRRKPKRHAARPEKYHHALKALAIRERKIHIAGKPELKLTGNPVYLDVEGDPDRDFYYLIGLRVKDNDGYVQHSFWADDASAEKEIWESSLRTLSEIENPQLIHYGSYETTFLKRMKQRYGDAAENPNLLDQLSTEAVNLLSVIYAQIYFPTYSNGLKEIARFLGYEWSESTASGLKSLMWRAEWELCQDVRLKQRLVTYNVEDCEALERIFDTVAQLCQRKSESSSLVHANTVYADLLKRDYPQHFGNNIFSMPELEYINQAAYWDYQREKIYVRSSESLRNVRKKKTKVKGRAKALPTNELIECMPPSCCPQCKVTNILQHNQQTKIVYDLKFGRTYIKRRIVRYTFHRYSCPQCGDVFYSSQRPWKGERYGPNILAYFIYQIIDLRMPQDTVAQSLNQLFGFLLDRTVVKRQKSRAAEIYKNTYEGILSNIVTGRLIHVDETNASIRGKGAYVWVLTNLEEATYFYTETREGDKVQELLKEFKGVLVTDFYTAYDSIDCPQQKCLIHLMRDLNDDLLKQPFNEEFKELVRQFTLLLKPMIETVDRFGLKAHFLRKHKVFVERFYKWLSKQHYHSEIAFQCKKRFEKNRNKIFTFLDYDGVPWNNNNAEHAVKAFAMLRKVIRGTSTEKGMQEYLTLLSICETCRYKGISFLDFLRSGEKDIDVFIGQNSHKSKRLA